MNAPVWIAGNPSTTGYAMDNTFRNISSQNQVIRIALAKVVLQNNYFENIYNGGDYLIFLVYIGSININNETFNNLDGQTFVRDTFIYIDPLSSPAIINGITVTNSITGRNSILKTFITIPGILALSNTKFENVTTTDEYPLISTGTLVGAMIQNITFDAVYKSDAENSNFLIEFGAIDLRASQNFMIVGLTITNSTVPFLNLQGISNSEINGASLTLSNIAYYDCNFDFSEQLISFSNIYSTSDFKITISGSQFFNIKFMRGGDLLNFQQQIDTQVQVVNTKFYNLTGASIHFESFNKQLEDNPTQVLLNNITVENVNGEFRSFINIYEGGSIEITGSSFSDVYNYFQGAVIFAGYQNTRTEISN